MVNPKEILDFWMVDPKKWYMKDDKFDAEIKKRFESTLTQLADGKLTKWMDTPDGALALIIVCDQFTRNMYRNSPKAYASDKKCLDIAKEAIKRGHDKAFEKSGEVDKLGFLYMPFMHSEQKADHVEALKLFNKPGLEDSLKYEITHKEIIDRFGRYCHRNEVLGRKSTPEEIEFMKTNKGF